MPQFTLPPKLIIVSNIPWCLSIELLFWNSMLEENINRSLTSSDYAQTKFAGPANSPHGHNYVPFLNKSMRFASRDNNSSPPIGTYLSTKEAIICLLASIERNLPLRTASVISSSTRIARSSRWAYLSLPWPASRKLPIIPLVLLHTSTFPLIQSLCIAFRS